MNYEALPGMEEALKLVQEKKMSKEAHKKAAKAGKRWQDSDGDGKWYEKGEDVKEGVRDPDPEKGTAERKARLEKKRGMKLDDHPQYKKEEVEEVAEAKGEKDCEKCEGEGCDHCDDKGYHAEGMKAARDNVGASTCWKGYKAKGTKMKGGKEVPNCVPANEELETMEASLMESGLFSDDEVRYIIGEKFDELEELYKGKHGQSEKEYQDGRSDGGKMVSGDSKGSGASYSSRAVKNSGPNPAGGSKKPQGQGRMTTGARADLKLRKANMKAGK